MKKQMRSVLAVFLAAILLLTTLPLSVLADGVELPVVMFEEDGSISDEAYPYLYDTAKFTNAYFYGGFDGYWQTYLVQAAYSDEEASARVREQEGIYYILADADLIHMVFGEFFPAPLGFVDDTVLPAMLEGEGLGEIPAYNEGTGEYLVQAISLTELWDDLFVYHGFIDNGDGTGSFYFAKVVDWEGEEPVLDGTGAEIVLRPTEEGIELVSHTLLEALPEHVDRTDEPEAPGPEPRSFDYEWGHATADFLEDYREEYLKQNINRELYTCAEYYKAYESIENGVLTLTWEQMEWVYNCCYFGDASPVDSETHKEFFDGTFVLDVAAGNIPGVTYVVDFENHENEDYFTVESLDPVNDRLHYEYRGWIGNENGDGGEFYFVKIENAWFDEETGETRAEYGEGGIRIELLVIDGRMTEMAYEYVETLPPEDAYSPEPEGPSEEDEYEREKRTAEFVEEYYYEEYGLRSVCAGFGYWLQREFPDRPVENDWIVGSPEELEAYLNGRCAPLGFSGDVIVPEIKAGNGVDVFYDEGTDSYRAYNGDAFGGGTPNYWYRGWTHEDGNDVFWFFKVGGRDESGNFYADPADPSGVKVVLRNEGGDFALVSHEIVDALPENFDPAPGNEPEPRNFDYEWGSQTADFLEDYREEYLKQNISRILFECADFNKQYESLENGVATLTWDQFTWVFENCFGHCNVFDPEIEKDFFDGTFVMDIAAGNINGITWVVDIGNPEDEGYFTVENTDPVNDRLHYEYRGWIENENGDGGEFYFVKIENAWIDAETGEPRAEYGEGGIRIELKVIDGRMTEMAYEYVETLPPDEAYSPEPGHHDEGYERRVAEFVETYFYENGSAWIGNNIVLWYKDVMPDAVTDDSVTVNQADFKAALECTLGDRPANFIDAYLLPEAKAGNLNGITYNAGDDTFTVEYRVFVGMAQQQYWYRGWTNEENGVDAFWFFKVSGVDDNGNFYPDPSDPSGVKVLLLPAGGEFELVDYGTVESLPERFNDDPGYQPTFEERFDREKRAADFVRQYNFGSFSPGTWFYYEITEKDPSRLEADNSLVVDPAEFEQWFREKFPDMPRDFYEEQVEPDIKAGIFSGDYCLSYNEASGKFVITKPKGGFGGPPRDEYAGWVQGEDGNDAFYYRSVDWEVENAPVYGDDGIEIVVRLEGSDVVLVSANWVDVLPENFDPVPGNEPGPEPGCYVPEDPFNADLYIEGDWNYDVVDDKVIIIRYLGEEATNVAIPDALDGHPVVGIASLAFMDRDNIETLYIPASVTDISPDAFFACSGLTEITLAQDMDPRDNRVVDGCLINNRDVLVAAVKGSSELPATKHIGDGSVTGRAGETAIITAGTEDIGAYAFAFSDDLKEVIIPDSVTRIGDCAFKDCGELEVVYYNGTPEDWNAIQVGAGNEAFENARVEFIEKRFIGQNVSVIAPNGTAARGTFLSGDGIELLPNEEKDRLPEGFETDNAYRAIVELSVGFETQEGYQIVPANLTGTVTVAVKIPEALQGKYLAAIWLPEEGDPVILPGMVAEDNYFLFDTDETGAFILTEPTLLGTAVRPGEPETVYEAGETITIAQDETLLLSFRQKYREFDLVPGWRNDLLNAQGFTCADEPVMIGETAHAQITAGDLAAGTTGTLTVGWYRFDDIFGENAVGWADAVPVYTCTFTLEVTSGEAPAILWGDANGDGKVDNKDIVRLKNYQANYDDETGISSNGTTTYTLSPGADANGDGKVDNKDIVRLKNYQANYDDETGISSNGTTVYILGPAV